MSTSVEDPSSTPVAVRATAPASPAPLSHTPSTLIPTMPATCTMAIIGIATMFRTNPAIPTRLNSIAATGKSVSSAASVAPHSPTSHRRPNAGVVSPGQRASCQATIRPAPTTMPNVAPKLSHAPASMTVSGSTSVTMIATTARTFRAGGIRPMTPTARYTSATATARVTDGSPPTIHPYATTLAIVRPEMRRADRTTSRRPR